MSIKTKISSLVVAAAAVVAMPAMAQQNQKADSIAIKKIYESAVNEAFLGDGRLDHEKFAIVVDDLTFHTSLSAPENAFRLDSRYLRTCIRNALLKRGY